MSGVQQNALQIGHDSVISQRLFQCRDCQQYVVIPSHLPPVKKPSTSLITGDLSDPDLEFPDQLECFQQFISDDLYPFQTSTSDSVTNYFSFSNEDLQGFCQPDSLSFPSSDTHHIPYSQAIDVLMAEKCPDLQDPYNPASVADTTAQIDVTSLLEMNVQQLRDLVHGLKESYDATQRETDVQIESIRRQISDITSQSRENTCTGEGLKTRVQGMEDYLPSLGMWAVQATQTLNKLQKPHDSTGAKRGTKKPARK